MHHLHLKEEFKNDKLRFFQQQAFDNNVLLKKWAMILLVALGIYQGILFEAILPKEVSITTPQTNYICTGLLSISITSYYTSIFKFSKKITKKIYLIRCLLVFLSVVCLTISLGLISYRETLDRIEHNNIEKWFYTLTMDRNAVWVILLIDILIPIWYFKILVPGVYWVISIIIYYHFDMEYKEGIIICYSFAALFTAMLWGMKAYHEWKVFIDRMNIEAWDDVHRNILDKVPDAIAIIDEQAKVIYSNSTFRSLCQDNLEDLSQKLTYCKNPRATSFLDSGSHNNEGKSPLNPQTEETCTFYPFSEILKQNILPIIKERQKLDNYLTFSARLTTNINNEASFRSYEIKLGSLLEYNKVILILSDTTQRDLAISLDTANQYKDKLLATVSHDLRAPINGSVSLLESSIEHRAVPEFIKEQFLIPAQRSCKFLLHLVNDILDFSQINVQKLRTDFETNSLRETIKSCYQLLEMQAIKKKIDFRLVLDENLPEIFTTDHNRLSQVIINLLTNAIKFTFSGSVTLRAHVIDDLVQIQVVDTGIGIKDEDKAKLFKEFTRIKYEQRRMNTRGVGLGLMIANKLARELGPSHTESGINLSSVYGQGSTFEFMLEDKRPMDDSKEADIPMEHKSSHFSLSFPLFINREEDFLFQKMDEGDLSRHGLQYSSQIPSGFSSRQILMSPSCSGTYRYSTINLRKKQFRGRVLIVDDDPINVMALENTIKQYGLIADTAYNGQEAIDKVRQNKDNEEQLSEDQERMCDTPKKPLLTDSPYQIIFMDYEMPIMNGLETTQALRELMQSQKINTIPIIGCTGHQTKQAQEDGFASGMVDMITKPPAKEKLLEILEKYLPSSN